METDRTIAEVGKVVDFGILNLSEEIEDEHKGLRKACPTPWPVINDAISGGFLPGQVTTLAGPAGNGKTYFCLTLCLLCEINRIEWRYLPLEDDQKSALRRLVACMMDDWSMVDIDKHNAAERYKKLTNHYGSIKRISQRVLENPRKSIIGEDGKPIVPRVPWESICEWIGTQSAKLIIIDPISQIDYDSRSMKPWEAQDAFVRKTLAMAEHTKCHVILVNHIRKRTGTERQKTTISMEDMKGSSAFHNLVHNVFLLDSHQIKDSSVYVSSGDGIKTVSHTRTLYLDKIRCGSGTGSKYAMGITNSPSFECMGMICKNQK